MCGEVQGDVSQPLLLRHALDHLSRLHTNHHCALLLATVPIGHHIWGEVWVLLRSGHFHHDLCSLPYILGRSYVYKQRHTHDTRNQDEIWSDLRGTKDQHFWSKGIHVYLLV